MKLDEKPNTRSKPRHPQVRKDTHIFAIYRTMTGSNNESNKYLN